MLDVAIARALHVLCIVLWIGGVGFVTTVVLPAAGRLNDPEERLAFFASVERRFAWQARVTVLIAGLTGFYMAARLELWDEFLSLDFWWLDAMVLVWLIFAAMLFLAEPLFLHRWLDERGRTRPAETFRLISRSHWTLLVVSLITVIGAVIGSHGGL